MTYNICPVCKGEIRPHDVLNFDSNIPSCECNMKKREEEINKAVMEYIKILRKEYKEERKNGK